MVPASDGRLVRLSNIVDFERGMSPGQIERYAQERSVTLISNLYQKPLADAYKEAYAAVAKQRMPSEYGIVTTGRGKLMQEAIKNFLIALALSVAFIYIVLAAQFESFIHPVTIMVSMFLAIPFGLLTLMALGHDPEYLFDHGTLPAHGGREEERDPAGGLHERPPRRGGCRGARRRWRRTGPDCAPF